METGGGGGRGHPYDRSADLVLRDVLDGFVSVEGAARHYGVAIREGAIDEDTTRARRAQRPQVKEFHRTAYVDVLA
jgi:N-methylhydantoinase B